MKKNTTYIPFESIMKTVNESGLRSVEKAGWIKVMGESGRRLYVPKTKRVGRVDLVGLSDAEGRRHPEGGNIGSVTHQLDMSRTETEIMAALDAALLDLATLPPTEKKVRVPKVAPKVADRKGAIAARAALLNLTAKEVSLSADEEEHATSDEVELLIDG